MKNNDKQVRGNLVRLGILNPKLTRQEILRSGFIFGLWTRQGMQDVQELDTLHKTLFKINVTLDKLKNYEDDKRRYDYLTSELNKERVDLKSWFNIGLWTYIYTWLLGHDYYETSTEQVRKLVLENTDVRKAASNLAAALQDIGWSNDKFEVFHNDKFVPFLYEQSLRKWVGDPNMAVMFDLEFEAKELDKVDKQDNSESRIKLATKELISNIPIFGKAIAVLIYWTRK
jgi:hypothetical protein